MLQDLTVAETSSPGSTIPPGIAHSPVSRRSMLTNSRTGLPSLSTGFPASSRAQRVTIGSAAWFGPHLPSTPLPCSPVLPCGLSGRPVSETV